MTKTRLKAAADGSVTIPKELLGDVEPGSAFQLEREGEVLRLEPAKQKLHEIKDPEKRAAAVATFMRRIAHRTGVSLPEAYNVREDIYD